MEGDIFCLWIKPIHLALARRDNSLVIFPTSLSGNSLRIPGRLIYATAFLFLNKHNPIYLTLKILEYYFPHTLSILPHPS